jgi:hypothetical protein
MTLDDLRQLIMQLMEERDISQRSGQFDTSETDAESPDTRDARSLNEIFASIERNRWTPPPGTPEPAQMIREDRDR